VQEPAGTITVSPLLAAVIAAWTSLYEQETALMVAALAKTGRKISNKTGAIRIFLIL
jgi:hypothetical protein